MVLVIGTFARKFLGSHAIDCWCRRWERTGLVEVLFAEPLPESEIITPRYADGFRHDPADVGIIAVMEAENSQARCVVSTGRPAHRRAVVLEDGGTDHAY